MCLSLQRPGAQRDFVWWEEVSGLSLAGDVSADFALAIFFIVVRERAERGREGGRERETERRRVRLLFLFGLPVQRVWAKRQVSGSHAFYPNRLSAAVWKWAAES